MNTILFDMDGVLIDSEPIIIRAALTALSESQIKADSQEFKKYIGAGEENFIVGPAKENNKEELTEAMLERMYSLYDRDVKEELMVYSGAAETIETLSKMGYTVALVSSSARRKLISSLDAAGIPKEAFSLILSGSDVTKRKPDPEPYKKAAEKLGKMPEECLVIEDAINGVISAKNAGMKCAAVTTSFPAGKLYEAGADYILNSLYDIIDIVK
ncbi:MAG: HAD family phosphatase [Clostridia bacterium]|nr:HAD family phosphatase [Clostridia bacterium]